MGLAVQAKGIYPLATKSTPPAPAKAPKPDVKSAPPVVPVKPAPIAVVTPSKITPTFSSKGATRSITVAAVVDKVTTPAHLARVTAYWASEGDYNTRHGISSTGIRLHGGHCAVDPHIIPYGSVVEIPGLGKYLAVDTGSAVVSRKAARQAADSTEERSALVVDLYFENGRDGKKFAANGPKYIAINWWAPTATDNEAKEARSLFADENWTKIQSKQL